MSNFTKSNANHPINMVYIDMLPSYISYIEKPQKMYISKLTIVNRLEYQTFLCQLSCLVRILLCTVYIVKDLSGEYLTLATVFYVARFSYREYQ